VRSGRFAMAVSVWPSSRLPEMAGAAMLTGGPAPIFLVGREVALALPAAFSAVTIALSLSPICELTTR